MYGRHFFKIGVVVIVFSGVLLSGPVQAGSYSIFLAEKYTNFTREPTGAGPGWTIDASHRSGGAYAIGPGLNVGIPLERLSVSIGGKALYVHSPGGGLATPVGVAANLRMSRTMAISSRFFYTPKAAFNSRQGGYVQTGLGVRMNVDPALLEVGWRYERVAGRNGAYEQKLLNGPYLAIGLAF
ncbi:YfaZ family outer membrane protein [Burkholderia metallica]|uniref:YfaZ family outer membrane protein n=1 Tax=Burkholderia metallica TaxID=488729 RepID=A0ABT8PHN9_9BURK|nr:YfaZ family outer membrane protein [Burkholderia metallica]MDN7934661.1 YfaZ family outer membrane protein [Burkholderia metallica]